MARMHLRIAALAMLFLLNGSESGAFLSPEQGTTSRLTEQQIAEAIADGRRFGTRNSYLRNGLKHKKYQIASAWAKDGISKYVTFFTDYDIVASAAAAAANELRELNKEELEKLPLAGMLYVNVQLHARGILPQQKLEQRYTRNGAHLVLEIEGHIIQPVSKQLITEKGVVFLPPVPLYAGSNTPHLSLISGDPLGRSDGKVQLEFAFRLSPEQMNRKTTVILIDGDGHRHTTVVDLALLQ